MAEHSFGHRTLEIIFILSRLCTFTEQLVLSLRFGGEESPGNKEHQAPEIGGRGNLTDSAAENNRLASVR